MVITTYTTLLRQRWVPALLLAGTLARLPLQMYSFALLLLVVQRTGSFATAGATAAAAAAGYAVAVPVQGRLVDRFGRTRILVLTAAINLAAFAIVPLAVRAGTQTLLVAAVLLGASLPPVAAAQRALWPEVVVEEAARRTAFTLDALLLDLALVVGPLLVTAISAVLGPLWAVEAGGVAIAAGTLWFSGLPPARARSGRKRSGAFAGPLRSPAIVLLLCGSVLTGTLLGVVRVTFVRFADAHAAPHAAGFALAAYGLGSLVGGLAYGAIRWSGDAARRLALILAGYAAGVALLACAPNPTVLVGLCLFAGVWLGPTVICTFELVGRCAPPDAVTESFAWGITATYSGSALGNSLGGALTATGAAFLVAACCAAVATLAISLGRKVFHA
ncbi:MFS transporter [Nocardia panacis]|uniref:MFS transporter n=1 Tax=Nocardia panacis TaxID=2340916 RepID=A0A3A4KBG0_9NOCA|nr:MFS transporter [Nocardia panacis]RJO70941.1 MFS transporter [Nocardia panacis]